jgi:ribosomal protein S18 acetylase RimI-like enzyme
LANEFIEALGLKNNLVSDIQINKLKHTIEIKKASDRDLTLISEFEKTIFDISLTYDLKQLKSMHANKNYQIFAAYSNLELVGYVIVSLSDNIDILKIFVVKHYRHCGIGKELINYVKRFKKPIILEVHQNNLTAISFYEALGFKQINIRKNYYGRHNAIVYFLNPVKNSKK